ncbi:MAG: hypothetical protein ACRDRP_07180 [Pseudonocardiaceae bacterium]
MVPRSRERTRPLRRPADRDEQHSRPLADCLDSYFAPQATTRAPSPPVTSSTALLDQLPAITIRNHPLTQLLCPAYLALVPGTHPPFGAE